MADVGHEVLAHLFQVVNAGHVPGQNQLIADAELGNAQLQDAVVVHRRGDLQRFAEIALGQVVGETWMADQVGKRLAQILVGAEAQMPAGGVVPVFQVAVLVDQHHHVLQGVHRLLGAHDDALQVVLGAPFLLEKMFQAGVELTPQADAVRRFGVFLAHQPGVQGEQLPGAPDDVQRQARHQRPDAAQGQANGHGHRHQDDDAVHFLAETGFHARRIFHSPSFRLRWSASRTRSL